MAINTNLKPQMSKPGKYEAQQVDCDPYLKTEKVNNAAGEVCMQPKINVVVNIATTTTRPTTQKPTLTPTQAPTTTKNPTTTPKPMPAEITVTALICSKNDAGYYHRGAEIPDYIRDRLIATYRGIVNHVGRCPELGGYKFWLDLTLTKLTKSSASMSRSEWEKHYDTLIKPEVEYAGNMNFTMAQQIEGSNSICHQAGIEKYPEVYPKNYSPRTLKYVLGSGNQCKLS